MNFLKDKKNRSEVWHYLAYVALLLGIALRLCLYFQNRNLFLDEANVARNIYERGFMQLLLPLSYEQYAPPLFLWALKILTHIGGYSEHIYKIVPLLSGIGSLFLLYLLLVKYEVRTMIWYPLWMMSTGMIYLRYATEVKQYSSDSFIALALIYLALEIRLDRIRPLRFALIWIVAGTVVIWSSMPSVFILAGVGIYYLAVMYRHRQRGQRVAVILTGTAWLLQFGLYYFLVLKPQIQSEYLQNSHHDHFLFLMSRDRLGWLHNWDVISKVLGVAAGHWALSVIFHLVCIAIAIYYAVRTRMVSILLLVVPMGLLLSAAALQQFTLEPRVVLFIMPLILILIAMGCERSGRYQPSLILFTAVSIICLYNFNRISFFYKPFQVEQITESMRFLQKEKISGRQLYVHAAAVPAYTYYTSIHPDHARWQDLKDATRLKYTANYDSVGQTFRGRSALLYSYDLAENINQQQADINKHVVTLTHISAFGSQAFIYDLPQ